MRKQDNEFFPTWNAMMQRCYDKNNHNYPRYGARGIYVCEDWKDFYNFEKWARSTIGHKTKKYTVDRIDNDGPYAPWNCKWSTPKEQVRHRRDTIMATVDGQKKPLAEWCEIYGLKYTTVKERIKRGWNIEECFKKKPREIVHQPEKRVCDQYYIINGVEKNVSDWAKQYNISRYTVYGRLNKGWNILDALTTPPNRANRVDKH